MCGSQTQGLATADHTTLLLNCYTKLKDVAKLDMFLHRGGADSGTPALNFDVDTAVKVGDLYCVPHRDLICTSERQPRAHCKHWQGQPLE